MLDSMIKFARGQYALNYERADCNRLMRKFETNKVRLLARCLERDPAVETKRLIKNVRASRDSDKRQWVVDAVEYLLDRDIAPPAAAVIFYRDYLRKTLPSARPRARGPQPNPDTQARNAAIIWTAIHVTKQFGVPLTRNAETKHDDSASAASAAHVIYAVLQCHPSGLIRGKDGTQSRLTRGRINAILCNREEREALTEILPPIEIPA